MDINTIIYLENEIDQNPTGGSIITITDGTGGDFEGETVTATKGTYSKSAVVTNGLAVIKGFTETGTVTVSVSNFTTTFNIDKYSKYEVSIGSNFYVQWLDSIDESSAFYSSLEDVLADEKMVRELFTRHASVDYLVSNVGNYPEELTTIINNDYCAKWINLRDYALDTLYANSDIASLMDQADKYFYGEWTIVDNTTTPPTWGAKGNVPVMTSNTAPYGIASAIDVYQSNDPYKAFDGNESTYYHSLVSGTTSSKEVWVEYEFTNPICVKKAYSRTDNGRKFNTITIKGSNDGTTWVSLGSNTDTSVRPNERTVSCSDNGYYKKIRAYYSGLQAESGAYCVSLYTLQFYGRELKVSVPKMTSNTAPYGNVIYNSQASTHEAYLAFDNIEGGYWGPSKGLTSSWIGYKFNIPNIIKFIHIYVESYGRTSSSLTGYLQGSQDGQTWEPVSTLTLNNLTTSTTAIGYTHYGFNITNNVKKYLYYRISFDTSIYVSDTNFCLFGIINFYGLDYSEYDWDEDNPRHYIYDHGVELETLSAADYTVGTYSFAEPQKRSNDIYIQTPSSADVFVGIGTSSSINLSNYDLERICVGNILKTADVYPSPILYGVSRINTIKQMGSSEAIATFDFSKSGQGYPNNLYLDVSSISNSCYTCILGGTISNGRELTITEWWLE